MLVADKIGLKLDGKSVLDTVSVFIAPGKFTVIIGPNGAGKSSLLACLSGLRRPDHGEIMWNGRNIGHLSPRERARHIGLLPQSADIYWDMKVRDLVALGRMPHQLRFGGVPGDDAQIDAAMAATGVTGFSARNIHTLSGGERARVLLARLLAGQPDCLLADEPLANLDPAHQIEILSLLTDQAANHVAVVAVLHDLNHAARVADHIILMKDGNILAAGIAADVLTPENLARAYQINCAVTQGEDGRLSVTILGRL